MVSVAPSKSSTALLRPGTPDVSSVGRKPGALKRLLRRPELGAFAGMTVVYLFFCLANKGGFTSIEGTASWMNTASELGVLAVPVGMLMIAGEFDLSVGSMIGASSLIVAIGYGYYNLSIWGAIAMAFATGVGVGLLNGIVTVSTGLPSFIVSLAGLFMIAGATLGLARYFTGTTAVSFTPDAGSHMVFGSQIAGFHISILWWLAVTSLATWILSRTPYGNWIYATGANRSAARIAGVPTDKVKISLFIASSMGAALVGVLQTIQYSGGDVTYGRDFVFDAPVAAVIGGVLLTGGYGSAIGVLLGSAIFGIVNVGVFYTGWNSDWAQLVLGSLLLLAVLGNNYFRQLALGGR